MRLLHNLFFYGSRKVAFGLWVFFVSTALIAFRRLEGHQWIECVAMSSMLVGGGTVLDKWLGARQKPNVENPPPA